MDNVFVALVCKNCGGSINLDEQTADYDWAESPSGWMYVNPDAPCTCPYCKTKYVYRDKLKPLKLVHGVHVSGSIITNGGDFIGNDKIVVHLGENSRNVAAGRQINQRIIQNNWR